jgi:predicted Fe-S protein YdhL (DUF1289 family)
VNGSTPPAIASPCTGICAIEGDDRCRGCARTLDEIATWGMMTSDQRTAVMADLPSRRLSRFGVDRHEDGMATRP